MKTYLITYDLINPQANLDDLTYAIRLIAINQAFPMPNVWKISTGLSADDIRNHLSAVLDPRDRLMVKEASARESVFDLSMAASVNKTGLRKTESRPGPTAHEPISLPC